MARTVKGRRTAFDNIAVGSATGLERTIAGTTLPHGAQTTPFANGERVISAGGSGTTDLGREHTLRTVSGGATTDFTTDLSH